MRISDWSSDVCSSDLLSDRKVASAAWTSVRALLERARRLAALGTSCEIPSRAIVMLSSTKLPAGGPDTGTLSIPSPSLGAGSCPAAGIADRPASAPRDRKTSVEGQGVYVRVDHGGGLR